MRRLLLATAFIAIAFGLIVTAGGVWGLVFTYQKVAQEKITTPEDAAIPNAKVRGPLTLKAQADVIREHTLRTTNGQTFAEMPRLVPSLNDKREPILDESGKPVMVENQARNIWITATTLTTALNLAIISYAISSFAILQGLTSILVGIVFYALSRKY